MIEYTDVRRFPRQIHLDFHTSPLIPGIGADFDPDAFAKTYADAHVQSVTVFAKCHHGMSYYPTKVGTPHPHLARPDLMGDMIEALHRRGIRVPLYTTVGFEEDVATRFPQWRQLRADGTSAVVMGGADAKTPQAGGWRYMDWLSTDYQDYIEAHVAELLSYDPDGLFFDILFHDRDGWSGDAAMRFRREHGFMANDDVTFAKFQSAGQVQFAKRFSQQIRDRSPQCGIFYNMPTVLDVDATTGSAAIEPYRTQWEIESLPSGFWGYYHFPRTGRRAMAGEQFWMGQTGRFQKMWGDFGGIKPVPALEFECFRSQALGGGNNVGDQLHPRGKTDPGVYRLIGKVYEQCAAADDFYKDTTAMPQAGIYPPPASDGPVADLTLEGAVQMCEESHYDAVVLDDGVSLDGLALVILPDAGALTSRAVERIRAFIATGGKVIVSARGGFDAAGQWALADKIPLQFDGSVDTVPTYWRPRAEFLPDAVGSDRVVYRPGMFVKPMPGSTVLVDRVPPYFKKRTDVEFSSHFQCPPVPEIDAAHPAVIAGDGWVYFADPIFREYRQTGNGIVRDAWRAAMERLIGPPPFGAGLPTTMLIYPRRHGAELRLTLLHYVPVRKAIDIDVVEERMGFAGEILHLPAAATRADIYGGGESVPREDEGFALPAARGRLLLTVPDFFK